MAAASQRPTLSSPLTGPSSGRPGDPVLLVIAGPSGAGKGTIVEGLRSREPGIWLSVSTTTRPPRSGETEGRDYHFVSRDDFKSLQMAGEFLEWFEVFGNLYGTPRSPVEDHLAAGHDVLLEIDVQGALAVRKAFPQAILVFIRPPSREAQRQRLADRGRDDEATISLRLDVAAQEESEAVRFDHEVINEDVDEAVAEVAGILGRHRAH